MSNAALLKIFNTMIFPHFTYCCTIWGKPNNADYVHKLCLVQERAASEAESFTPDFHCKSYRLFCYYVHVIHLGNNISIDDFKKMPTNLRIV
jgi:hypothetical protein